MVGMWLQSPLVGQPDFPLVFFTIFLQMSVGMIVVLLLTKLYRREDVLSADSAALTRQVVNVSLILAIAGSIASLAHLGQPMKSYRALYYHLSSWMGQEVLLVGLFTLSLLAYAIILSRGGSPKPAIEIFAANEIAPLRAPESAGRRVRDGVRRRDHVLLRVKSLD